jgi:hypothetical protein
VKRSGDKVITLFEKKSRNKTLIPNIKLKMHTSIQIINSSMHSHSAEWEQEEVFYRSCSIVRAKVLK